MTHWFQLERISGKTLLLPNDENIDGLELKLSVGRVLLFREI